MPRNFVYLVSNLLLLLQPFLLLAKPKGDPKKILIVASNTTRFNGQENGTYLVELIFPYIYFKEHGFEVDVMSAAGGKVAVYHNGTISEKLKTMLNHSDYNKAIEHSLRPYHVKAEQYVAVYYPGGYGQFSDVLNNDSISAISKVIHERGGFVCSAGHGTASLLNIRLSTGEYFVQGKYMTCFPWWAEQEFMEISQYGKALPFNMEEEFRKRGALVHVCSAESTDDYSCRNVSDPMNRLITGSFADDALWVAQETVRFVDMKFPGK